MNCRFSQLASGTGARESGRTFPRKTRNRQNSDLRGVFLTLKAATTQHLAARGGGRSSTSPRFAR